MTAILRNPNYQKLFGIWLGWVVVMFAFQAYVPARMDIARPDRSLEWTVSETQAGSQRSKPYLNDPFLNSHVSWDSEFYLAIANGGYEDPDIARINATFGEVSTGGGFWPFVIPSGALTSQGISLSYAFFPFYPFMIRLLAFPLSVLGLTPIATATLAGVMISTLGTLLAMVAIYELARPELGEDGGLRAAFYLIIFPSSFFFAQVYTEGLFVGLAFASLALMQNGNLRWAALLAVFATFTRAVGIALVIPLFFTWARSGQWRELDMEWKQLYYKGLPWKAIGMAVIASAPVLAFFIWRVSYYGMAFNKVEDEFFGRGLMSFGSMFINWADAFRAMFGSNSQAAAYYWVEWGAVILGFTACISYLRRRPELAWFGLLVVFLSFTSGPAQGMHRYILAAPPVFLFLSRLGRNAAFDRSWTVASILLMAIYTTLFSFDMWTG